MDIGKETIVGETGNIFPNTVHSFYLDSNSTCKFIHIHIALTVGLGDYTTFF